ncbi:MAG TPA: glycosyltransferase family 4 protein [Steroidobacteraceae bacterium]|jgi:glycosyltransferase involved in cell wall biosynthesis
MNERLNVLLVSPMAPSPPRFGAQARAHGLLSNLAKHHDLTAIVLHEDSETPGTSGAAMRAYCREVMFVPNPNGLVGWWRRGLQARSWVSRRSYQRHLFTVPALEETLARVLSHQRFDVVFVNLPYLAHYPLRRSPPGAPAPAVVIDSHDIGYDLARQIATSSARFGQRLHARLNWRKLAREELAAYNAADGVCVCSAADQKRLAADAPSATTVVIPNAADIEYLQPRQTDPKPDGRTVLFFGLLATVPNVDGVVYFLREIWPLIAAVRPDARFVVIGADPAPAIHALAGPGVTIVGPVDDLRPHLAAASAVVVPLRLGSGTRLKILEAWAMARPVVSTTLGAEGLDAVPGRHLLVADDPADFARSVLRILGEPGLGDELGREGRALVSERYSWRGAAGALGAFFKQVLARRDAAPEPQRGSAN